MPADDTLFQVLRLCNRVEFDTLAAVLDVDRTTDREFDIVALSKALRAAAGDSFANLFRGDHELEYREILTDVADALSTDADWSPQIEETTREEWLEDYISLAAAFVDAPTRSSWSKEQIATARNRAIDALKGKPIDPPESSGAFALSTAAAGAVVGVFFPVATLAIFGAGALALLSGPATRKTIPATLILIHARRRTAFENHLLELDTTETT